MGEPNKQFLLPNQQSQYMRTSVPSTWKAVCCPVRGAGGNIDTCLKEMLRGLLPARKMAVAQIRFSIVIVIYGISVLFLYCS